MASELCMNCFRVKGNYEVCPYCGYMEGTPPEQPHYLIPGTIIGGHFVVGTAIGFGGFGITYKCFDMTLGVVVAVKEFYPVGLVNRAPGEQKVGLLSGDKQKQYKQQLDRFLMEARSIAQFGNAKDIVNVYDFFEENGTAYIIMEYIDGILLKDYMEKQGAMSPEAAMGVILPIIDAVKKIHSKGIVHQDISPDNIFIASEDSIKVFDFGAARLNDSKEGTAGESVIKVGYSAPEQYREKSRQGFYTDVYSVGAIMYQLLTGTKPLESTEREHKDTLQSPKELGVKISSNMDRAVMEAMAVQPELRFQGIQQFEEALENKRVAEYPKDKLKKGRHRRNAIVGISALLALAIVIVIGLYSTILKPKNPLFETKYAKELKINVWVENKDQMNMLQAIVEDGYKPGTSTKSSEEVRKMQKDNDNNVTVEITAHPNMEADLQAQKKHADEGKPNQMPDMFLTDHVSDLDQYDLVSLKDNVYASLDTDNYMYMSEYKKQFPDMKEMPTGLDTLLVYSNEVGYNKDNGLNNESNGNIKANEKTVDISSLITEDTSKYTEEKNSVKFLNQNLATFPGDSAGKVLSLMNDKQTNDDMKEKTLTAIEQFNKVAMVDKYQINRNKKSKEKSSGIYGSKMVAGVSYRQRMEEQKNSNSGRNRINALTDYQTYVATYKRKMLVIMSERYAISASTTKDERLACERLLWIMMSQSAQAAKSRGEKMYEVTFPILKSELETYKRFNAKYGAFNDCCKKQLDCVLIGKNTANIDKFTKGLSKATDLKKYYDENAKKYIFAK